jgi:hypothetical protein
MKIMRYASLFAAASRNEKKFLGPMGAKSWTEITNYLRSIPENIGETWQSLIRG